MIDFMMYYNNNEGLDILYAVDEDTNLSELFAKFVNMTRMVGYQPGSWDKIIEELNKYGVKDGDYSIFEWADDVIYS